LAIYKFPDLCEVTKHLLMAMGLKASIFQGQVVRVIKIAKRDPEVGDFVRAEKESQERNTTVVSPKRHCGLFLFGNVPGWRGSRIRRLTRIDEDRYLVVTRSSIYDVEVTLDSVFDQIEEDVRSSRK